MTISEFTRLNPDAELVLGRKRDVEMTPDYLYIVIKLSGLELYGGRRSCIPWLRRPKMTISNFLKENPNVEVQFGRRVLYYIGEAWRVVDNGSALNEKQVVLDTMNEDQAVAALSEGYDILLKAEVK